MRIAEIHVYRNDLPVSGADYVMSVGAYDGFDSTIVRIVTDTGLTGWGETCPVGPVYQPHHAAGARAAITEMAPGLIGGEVLPGLLRTRMDGLLNGHGYAKAALDIAALDVLGKAYGVRVCDLLGGAHTDRVPSYYATSVGAPDDVARIAREKVAEGYPRLQIKVGGRKVETDIEVIRKVHEAVGPGVRLAADANRGWTARDTLFASKACADIQMVIEQPCNTMDEIAGIRGRLQHPVFLDESAEDLGAVLRAVGAGLCDGFGLKVTRLGGLTPFAAVRDVCAARGLPHTCDDAWGGDIIAAACVHIGATVQPHLLEGVWLAAPYIAENYDSGNGIRIDGGHIAVPTAPGLGITPADGVFGDPVASFG